MSKIYFTIAMVSLLSACGGGGSDSPAVAATAANTTPGAVSPAPAPVATTPSPATSPATSAVLTSMPAVAAGTTKYTVGSMNQGTSAQVMDMTFNAAVNMTVSGDLNKIWVDAKATGGTATVSGNQNTIVFRPGVATTVNVTGSANTFIMAEGSTIKIEGTGAAASTVQYYK